MELFSLELSGRGSSQLSCVDKTIDIIISCKVVATVFLTFSFDWLYFVYCKQSNTGSEEGLATLRLLGG